MFSKRCGSDDQSDEIAPMRLGNRLNLRHSSLCIALAVLCASFCSAQTTVTGALSGTVSDTSGAVVPSAQVTITNESTGESRSVTSSADGRFSVLLLPPDHYRVLITKDGFKAAARAGVQINVTETATLNVALEIGAVTETVTVGSDQELLQTDTSALGRVVSSQEVSALPLVARNYTQILGLSPGVNMSVTNAGDLGRGNSSSSGGLYGVKIVNGARPTDNNFQLNGIPVNDNFAYGAGSVLGIGDVGGGLPVPNPDAIDQFKVQTAQYDASFGRNAGGNVNIVTKTGTSAFHGSIFEFFRNDALNANDFFRNEAKQPREVLRQNQFGFTLGGPILTNKLFFFTSYQGTRQSNGIAAGCAAVYTGPPLTNDRSQSALGALFAGQSGASGGEAIRADGSNINPVALAMLNLKLSNGQYLIPTPQTVNPGQPLLDQGFSSFSLPCTFAEDQVVANVSFQQSENSSFSARYFQALSNQNVTLALSNIPGIPAPSNDTFRNFSLTHTYIFSSHIVNEAVVGYNNSLALQPVAKAETTQPFDFRSLGMNVPSDFGQSVLSVNGSLNADPQGSLNVNQPAISAADSLSYVHGRHSLRFGGGLSRSYISISDQSLSTSLYFNSFPDLLLGLPGGPTSSGGNGSSVSNVSDSFGGVILSDRKFRKWDESLYVQDDYQLSKTLVLNLGFRYDRLGALSDALGRLSTFDRTKADPNPPSSGSYDGFVVAANFPASIPTGVVKTSHDFAIDGDGQNSFAPRFGFSWQMLRGFLLRGGYGIYASEPAAAGTVVGVIAPPYFFSAGAQGSANPSISLQNPFQGVQVPNIANLPQFTPYSTSAPIGFMQYQNPHYRPGYVHEFTLNTQTDLGHDLLLELAYVGAHGVHLGRGLLPNEALQASAAAPIRGQTTNTVANINQRVPILGFYPTSLVENETGGQSWYNGLQASVTKRLSKGSQFLVSYTFSKNLDTDAPNLTEADQGTSNDAIGNDRLPHGRYGRTNFDRAHRFVASYIYDLPGRLEWMATEWSDHVSVGYRPYVDSLQRHECRRRHQRLRTSVGYLLAQ